MGLDIPRAELRRLREINNMNFYSRVIYNSSIPKKCRNLKCSGCRDIFIYKTKKLMKKGMYTEAISNLKILYYEKGIGINFDTYYDMKIEPSKINREFLKNQKLLLNDFFGGYMGIMSKLFLNNLYALAVPFFLGIVIIIATKVMNADYNGEVIKQYIVDNLANKDIGDVATYINSIKSYSIMNDRIAEFLAFSTVLGSVFAFIRFMKNSLNKETFYKLCLQAVEELLNEVK